MHILIDCTLFSQELDMLYNQSKTFHSFTIMLPHPVKLSYWYEIAVITVTDETDVHLQSIKQSLY